MLIISNILERRRGTWIELFANSGDSIRLPAEMAAGIGCGAQINAERWQELRRESEYHLLLDKALRLLGHREHFALELQRKLAQRSFDKPLINRVLQACRERGYLEDARAAGHVTTQALQRGGIGRLRLKAMLLERGCPDELLESALRRFAETCDEAEIARELLASKRSAFANKRDRLREKLELRADLDPRKLRMLLRVKLGQAVGNFMYARGFSGEEVNRAGRNLVDELLAELEYEKE